MKRILFGFKMLLLFGLTLVSTSVSAANRTYGGAFSMHRVSTVNHLITVGASAGYSTIIENYDDLSTQGDVGALFGIGYEMRTNGFYLSTGVEAQLVNANAVYSLSIKDHPILDTQGKPAVMHYAFDPITEYQRITYVQIPLILGYNHCGFYVGAGAKVGFPVQASVQQLSSYKTSVTYNEYVEDFEGMGNHGYGEYTLDSKESLDAKLKVSLAAEIGYDLLKSLQDKDQNQRNGLKLSAVFEYGLTNIAGASKMSDMFEVSPDNASQVIIKPFYHTQSIIGHHVNNLYAGIKLTWTCDLSSKPYSSCMCNK